MRTVPGLTTRSQYRSRTGADRVEDGADPEVVEHECASWLDEKVSDRTRQALLSDRQHASSIQREVRSHRKSVKLAD